MSILDVGTLGSAWHRRVGAAWPRVLVAFIRRTALITLGAAASARAQEPAGLPPHFPINPNTAERSGVFSAPYRAPHQGWLTSLLFDYASVVENQYATGHSTTKRYLTDAEVMRTEVNLSRDVSATTFLEAQLGVHGAYDGWFDTWINWAHRRLGQVYRARTNRPINVYGDTLRLPGVGLITRRKTNAAFNDLRLSVGRRYGEHLQSVLSITLPTSTGPGGYGRGVVSLNAVHTLHVQLLRRFTLEGTAGVGYTPKHGRLTLYQRDLFASGTAGAIWRFWGTQSSYVNFFYHSPYYHGTTFGGLDNYELSLDFGWLRRLARGREWRVGFTEDPRREDPAVDLVFMFGASW